MFPLLPSPLPFPNYLILVSFLEDDMSSPPSPSPPLLSFLFSLPPPFSPSYFSLHCHSLANDDLSTCFFYDLRNLTSWPHTQTGSQYNTQVCLQK